MLELFKQMPLFASAGKVACKARACDVDVETCAGCPALDRIVLRGERQLVYCDRYLDRTLSVLTYPR